MVAQEVLFDQPGTPLGERQVSMVGLVFFRILKSASLVLAALIAPLAYLTKKPTVPAMLGTAIVVLEMLQLLFHFHDTYPQALRSSRRSRRYRTHDRTQPNWGEGDAHFPRN
jgi:hypothetical protein